MIPLTDYQQFIHKTRYAKWDGKRRETWEETVNRYMKHISSFMLKRGHDISDIYDDLERYILDRNSLPSMRGMMTAGKALERDESAIFNCAYLVIKDVESFCEVLEILMLGTGVGFSVEKQFVNKLKKIPTGLKKNNDVFTVQDSRAGWVDSVRYLMNQLYEGLIPAFDYCEIRPAGTPLKTFGGRASGPESIRSLHKFIITVFKVAAGRKLRPIEAHSILCKLAMCAECGGQRRAAMISLSDLDDTEMRDAKAGKWYLRASRKHFIFANNSAVYESKPSRNVFDREWKALRESGSGERGIFNREAARKKAEKTGRTLQKGFGINPCGEIVLNPGQFCNLTNPIVREEDSIEDIKRKIRVSAIIGTMQAMFDKFPNLRQSWTNNQIEERLLGVGLGGIVDNEFTRHPSQALLEEFNRVAKDTNIEFSERFGINPAAAVTTVKPDGNSSQLTGASSGIHPTYSEYYIRRVRIDKKDPIAKMLTATGHELEQNLYDRSSLIFSYPIKSAKGAVTRHDMNAIAQLELYLMYQTHWADHNVSNTVYIDDNEWDIVGDWVYEHFDDICGVSFLPKDNGTYVQAPYTEITEKEYKKAVSELKPIDWSLLEVFEIEDQTTSSREIACGGGSCEIV